jgi:hypothetical protein
LPAMLFALDEKSVAGKARSYINLDEPIDA